MMNNLDQLIIIVGADVIVAQVSDNDSNHNKTLSLSEKLKLSNTRIIYPVTAILEAVTVLQKKQNSVLAYGVANLLTSSKVKVAQVNDEILTIAMTYFKLTTSKKTHCVIVLLWQLLTFMKLM